MKTYILAIPGSATKSNLTLTDLTYDEYINEIRANLLISESPLAVNSAVDDLLPISSKEIKVREGYRPSAIQTAPLRKANDPNNLLPEYSSELHGKNEVRVRNPNTFSVAAGIRMGNRGKNLTIPAHSIRSVYVPDGSYEIYFVYSNKPDALFKGDNFRLRGNGVEIQIVKVVDGNYKIRRVK